MIDPILKILRQNAKLTPAQIAERLEMEEKEVAAKIEAFERDGTIMGYQTVLNDQKAGNGGVMAVIEIKITPERGGGFDRLAHRIAQFEQVKSCYLMSGGYDVMALVEGDTLPQVAQFIAEKLSTISGVLSTTTHFQLKVYKENGMITQAEKGAQRLPVSP